ncbi:MAG TPA: LON peptidase substrate-binding domain-containing protein [Oxalicibacterium sp.]
MPNIPTWLPLFPLHAVLFPDGILPLKVFETRYIDMVRDCMRREIPFGAVLIRSGKEVGAAAEPEDVGCLAHITEWDAEQLGLLMLRTQGGQRFRIIETRVHKDQHLEARIELIAPDAASTVTQKHEACAATLGLIIADLRNGKRAKMDEETMDEETEEDFDDPFPPILRLDDAGWVANRWSEVLPIPLKARQKLLELPDPQDRLEIIHQYLMQHNII